MTENREELEARITAYIDGELPPAEAARLEVFLANTDPRLAEQVIGMLGDKNRIRSLPKPTAPADLAAHVMEQVERATLLNDVEHLSHPHRAWWQTKAAIAAGLVLLVGGFSIFVVQSLVNPHPDDRWNKMLASSNNNKPGADLPGAARPSDMLTAAKSPAPVAATSPTFSGSTLAMAKSIDKSSHDMKNDDRGRAVAAIPESRIDATRNKSGLAEGTLASVTNGRSEEVAIEQLTRNREVLNGEASPAKYNYKDAASAAKALSNLSINGSMATTDPIVLTLVARDNQDYMNLRAALLRCMGEDSAARRQTALQNRYLFNLNSLNTLRGVNSGNPYSDNNANTLNNSGNVNSKAGNQIANGAMVANNGDAAYKFYNPAQGNFELTAGVAGNFDVTTGNITPSPASNSSQGMNSGQTLVQGQNSYQPAQVQNSGQQRGGNWDPDLASPYRVALRQDQLQQIAAEFRVHSIACGQLAYVITPENKDRMLAKVESGSAAAWKKGGESPLESKHASDPVGGENWKSGKSAPPAPNAPNAAPATVAPSKPAGPAVQAPYATQQNKEVEKAALDRQQAADETQHRTPQELQSQRGAGQTVQLDTDAVARDGGQDRWVDCIIKMEPAPVQANLNNDARLNTQQQTK